jgi:hypothetical protein
MPTRNVLVIPFTYKLWAQVLMSLMLDAKLPASVLNQTKLYPKIKQHYPLLFFRCLSVYRAWSTLTIELFIDWWYIFPLIWLPIESMSSTGIVTICRALIGVNFLIGSCYSCRRCPWKYFRKEITWFYSYEKITLKIFISLRSRAV